MSAGSLFIIAHVTDIAPEEDNLNHPEAESNIWAAVKSGEDAINRYLEQETSFQIEVATVRLATNRDPNVSDE
jgi:hypothetical protein